MINKNCSECQGTGLVDKLPDGIDDGEWHICRACREEDAKKELPSFKQQVNKHVYHYLVLPSAIIAISLYLLLVYLKCH